ncbi:MAG: tetratricopeptide repeat protein [Pseudomonadota bacterium]|nr:tetratricopeptide repeat protein [Pseudomonadota bacterium]
MTPPEATLVSDLDRLARLHATGPQQQAAALAIELTQRLPNHRLAWTVLGSMLQDAGRTQEAWHCLETALKLAPDDAEVNNRLGVICLSQNRLEQAEALFTQAVASQPTMASALGNLGIVLHARGDLAGAQARFREALALQPDSPENLANLGAILQAQRRSAEARACFERALEMSPRMAGIHCNLGLNCIEAGLWAQAEASLRKAIELQPQLYQAHDGLGLVLREKRQLSAAEASCRQALAIAPQDPSSLSHLGVILSDSGRLKEAAACLRQAAQLRPDDASLFTSYLFCLTQDEAVSADELFREHRAFGAHFEARAAVHRKAHTNQRDPERKLRVGFVSGDLRNHAVAYFVDPVWAAIDRDRIEIRVYSTCGEEDFVTAHLRQLSDAWVQVESMSDDELTEQIRHDEIDVLFDVSGHTAHNRLPVFCRKPAPVQVTWLGYPNSTGLMSMDYMLCDRFNSPHGLFERYYTEKFARIPTSGAFIQNLDAPPVNDLPMLTNGYVTFGSFNRISKLGDRVIATWARVMHRVPGSRLLLGSVSDEQVRTSLTQRFERQGITADRLDLRPTLPLNDYLRLHHEVDLILDTWPYTGGTTTNHALWMGVPVLTIEGPSRAHCQAASGMGKMGLPEWIAMDPDDFVERAVRLGSDPAALAALRSGMRDRWRSAPLRQPTLVARGLEAAARQMWQRWCQGLPAEHLDIALPMP